MLIIYFWIVFIKCILIQLKKFKGETKEKYEQIWLENY